MITLPRNLLVILGGVFSTYHVLLGLSSMSTSNEPVRVYVALGLYAVATFLSLALGKNAGMPSWLAFMNVGVSLSIALLAASTLDPTKDLGYGTWYVAAIGTLMTITAVRRHVALAWFGLGLLAAQTIVWAGPGAIAGFGVIGDVVWVALAHVFAKALSRATVDVRQFARAEREAVEWQAAQDAHHFERQVRLTQTSRMALPMLERIAAVNGELDDDGRFECAVLEQSIRDEIRGRRLLNDAVRDQVVAARRRGAFVQVLDDGGVDDIDPVDLDPVLDRVAEALASVQSDRIIIRTAPKGSTKAITVVGLSSSDDAASALGDDEEDDVDLWLELDRPAGAPVPVSVD